jgi:sortase A
MRLVLAYLRRALTVVAVVCLGGWATVKTYAYVSTVRNEAVLDRLVRERRGSSLSALHGSEWTMSPPSDGSLLGRIDIPEVGVSAIILQGSGERWLAEGAGHVPGTALPGTDGNAVVAGHRDSVFSGLKAIRLGDAIEVTTPSVTRVYRVDSIRIVDPSDTAVLAPAPGPRLTLITCYPFHYIGPAPHRFVVGARAVALGAEEIPVPRRGALVPRLEDVSLRRRTSQGHARTAQPPRRTDRPDGGVRLPAARPLPMPLRASSSAKPPRVSWLRRLLHLGPRRSRRR